MTYYNKLYKSSIENLVLDLVEGLNINTRQLIFAINPKKIVLAHNDAGFNEILKHADIYIADGIGYILATELIKKYRAKKITGIDLMNGILDALKSTKHSIYILGASKQSNDNCVRNILHRFPMINIAGNHHGYFDDLEEIIHLIINSGAEVLFVGMGSPLQERIACEVFDKAKNIKLILGVGGSIDILSGQVKRAPKFIQKINLEWLFRMFVQPRRFADLKYIFQFFILFFRERKED